MNSPPIFLTGWSLNPGVLLGCVAAVAVYAWRFRTHARWNWFAPAMVLVLVALLSPIATLADGVLFTAHMMQHLLLLVFAPALLVLSVPATKKSRAERAARAPKQMWSAIGWPAGVGAMWLWHMPVLCNAAVTHPIVRAVQTISLLTMGMAFWWPILTPDTQARLSPGAGIAYLFTACLACSALGMLLTLTSVEVCTAFVAPRGAADSWAAVRTLISPKRDRAFGGLLMWVPMCLVYVGAIMLELARWFSAPSHPHANAHS